MHIILKLLLATIVWPALFGAILWFVAITNQDSGTLLIAVIMAVVASLAVNATIALIGKVVPTAKSLSGFVVLLGASASVWLVIGLIAGGMMGAGSREMQMLAVWLPAFAAWQAIFFWATAEAPEDTEFDEEYID